MMNYWLVKTEEDVYPISQLKKDKETLWDGVRNYQARNFLKSMKKGDLVFVYHSNTKTPGIVGLATVSKEFEPDPLQFNKKSKYFDEKSSKDKPRWFCPTLKYKKTFKTQLSLDEIKGLSFMKDSPLVGRGNRLSVIPITEEQGDEIIELTY